MRGSKGAEIAGRVGTRREAVAGGQGKMGRGRKGRPDEEADTGWNASNQEHDAGSFLGCTRERSLSI